MPSNHPVRLMWIGPKPGGLGWLLLRMQEEVQVLEFSQFDAAALADACQAGLHRIVLACTDRLSYPHATLTWLAAHYPEIPIALAQDSWWDGAGRTGLQRRTHLSLAWYRWWDGWNDWLSGRAPSLFAPCPTLHAPMNVQAESRGPAISPGLVVANCKNTSLSWKFAAKAFGMQPSAMGLQPFLDSPLEGWQKPAWILWDDTCLDTQRDETQQCAEFFQIASRRFPSAVLCAAFSMPRWNTWNAARQAGAAEIFAKPSTGNALGQAFSR